MANASLYNGLVGAAAALLLAVLLIAGIAAGGLFSELTYRMKEILVAVIAFLAALLASYVSIQAVRNGGIEKVRRP